MTTYLNAPVGSLDALDQAAVARRASSGTSLIHGDTSQQSAQAGASLDPNMIKSMQPHGALINKYFNPTDTGKATWTSYWESGGDPAVQNLQGGIATGLFQIQNLPGRPDPEWLKNPENNTKYASWMAYGQQGNYQDWNGPKDRNAKADFTAWGDNGATYNGKPFGALSAHPYTDSTVAHLPPSPVPPDYDQQILASSINYSSAITRKTGAQKQLDFYQQNFQKAKDAELDALNASYGPEQQAILGKDLNKQLDADLAKIDAKYNAQETLLKNQLKAASDEVQATGYWRDLVTNGLQVIISDTDTDIRSYDDLIKFLNTETQKGTPVLGFNLGSSYIPQFSPEQQDFLTRTISSMSPYFNKNAPKDTMKQVDEILSAAATTYVPSQSISIAGLSSDAIRHLFTTLPNISEPIPSGLTDQGIRDLHSSINLASPETQAAVSSLQGQAKELVSQWVKRDNEYAAYKNALTDPTDNLSMFKNRELGNGEFTLQKLLNFTGIINRNVAQPLGAFGISGLEQGSNLPGIAGGLSRDVLKLLGGSRNNVSNSLDANRTAGQNWWEAAGNAERSWDANAAAKMLIETISDPTTYIGFGIYPKVFGKVPLLGHAVEAIDGGFAAAFNNPIVSQLGAHAAGAGIAYTISGGDLKWTALGAAVPGLRFVPLFTGSQLVEKHMATFMGIFEEANKSFHHTTDLNELNGADLYETVQHAFEAHKTQPTTAHLSDTGPYAKMILQGQDHYITRDEVTSMISAAREDALRPAETGFEDMGVHSKYQVGELPEVTNQVLSDINVDYERLLHSSDSRGIIAPSEAAADIAKHIGLPSTAVPVIEDVLKTRIDNLFTDVLAKLEPFAAGDGNTMAKQIFSIVNEGIKSRVADPLHNYNNMQGYVLGLMGKVEPITHLKLYKGAAWVQQNYARASLWFFNFKPMNILETFFRAGFNGGGWDIPFHVDHLYATNAQWSFHQLFPNTLRSNVNPRMELSLTDKATGTSEARSMIREAASSSKKNPLIRWMDNAYNKIPEWTEQQIRASSYEHDIIDSLARAYPEKYLEVKTLKDALTASLRNSGLTAEEIESRGRDLFAASWRKDGPAVIRKMITNLPTQEKRVFLAETYKAMDGYVHLDPAVKNTVVQELSRRGPDELDKIIEEAKSALYEHPVVKADAGVEALKVQADAIAEHMASTDLSQQEVADLIRHSADIGNTISEVISEIRSAATVRGHAIPGDAAHTEHWSLSNEAINNYMANAETNYRRIIDSIRPKVGTTFSQAQADVINQSLDLQLSRAGMLREYRQNEVKVISDWEAAHGGHRPGTKAVWDDLNAQRESIHDKWKAADAKLLDDYQALAQVLPGKLGNIADVSKAGLAIKDVAALKGVSADELSQSLLHNDSLMSKEHFVADIHGIARGKAANPPYNTSAEAMGWSTDAIGQLYDSLRIRMGTNPTDSPYLLVANNELDGLRQDIAHINIGTKRTPAQAQTVNDLYEQWAQHLETNPVDQSKVTEAFEQARFRHEHKFTDYTHQNLFDAAAKNVFPFWNYQAQRYPFLLQQALTKPGLVSAWGRYNDYSEKGYFHVAGTDIAANLIRGTVLQGGLNGLIRQFPASYEKGSLGGLAKVEDSLSNAGFFPGFFSTLPLNLAGIQGWQLPSIVDDPINLAGQLNPHILEIRNRLFPNEYRQYYTSLISANLAQDQELVNANGDAIGGDKIRRDIESGDIQRRIEAGTASDIDRQELSIWRDAEKKVARYQLLFDQTGVFKLDPQAKRDAEKEAKAFIQEKTGVTPEQQDAITTRLGDSGMRLSDVIPLDPASQKQLYELTKFRYWNNIGHVLQQTPMGKMADKIEDYYNEVTNITSLAHSGGLTDSKGNSIPSLASLDEQFRAGKISATDWLNGTADTNTILRERINGLTTDKNGAYYGVPVTLEARAKYTTDRGIPMPVEHPAKELLNLYFSLSPEKDATGALDFNSYFSKVDGLLAALPVPQRQYLLDYIQQNWTPTQKLYWQTNRQYLRPYFNVTEGVLQTLIPAQQDFIRAYIKNPSVDIKNLPASEQQLISDYNAATSRARTKYRQLDPSTDAWLFYWNKEGTLQTEAARKIYNDIITQYGGGRTYDTPIDMSKYKGLPPLPVDNSSTKP